MEIEKLRVGPWGENCYLISNNGEAVFIDPGGKPAVLLEQLQTRQLQLRAIVNTHGHFDHIGAVVPLVDATGASFYISAREVPVMKTTNMLRFIFKSKEKIIVPTVFTDLDQESETFSLIGLTFQRIETPGHTPGGHCFQIENHLFSGDTVLSTMPGTAELPGGNRDDMANSLKLLGDMDPKTILYPGHGAITTLGAALASVPTVRDDDARTEQ